MNEENKKEYTEFVNKQFVILRKHFDRTIQRVINKFHNLEDSEELKQLYKVRNDDAKDYAETITKKDAQKDLFIEKLKEATNYSGNYLDKNRASWFNPEVIYKINKEVFEDG